LPCGTPKATTVIIGIDPGLTATGYGIIRGSRVIRLGTIRPGRGDVFLRIQEICDALERIVAEHRPGRAALEKAFYHKNVSSLVRISEVRGAIVRTLLQAGLTIADYTPTSIKLTTTGSGRASKPQVRYFIERLFGTNGRRASHHAVDALAIAYTAYRKSGGAPTVEADRPRRRVRFQPRIGG